MAHGTYRYAGRQMVTLKMANTQQNGAWHKPGTFLELPYAINI